MKLFLPLLAAIIFFVAGSVHAQTTPTIPDSMKVCTWKGRRVASDKLFPFKIIGSNTIQSGLLVKFPKSCPDRIYFFQNKWVEWRSGSDALNTRDMAIFPHTGFAYVVSGKNIFRLNYHDLSLQPVSRNTNIHSCTSDLEIVK